MEDGPCAKYVQIHTKRVELLVDISISIFHTTIRLLLLYLQFVSRSVTRYVQKTDIFETCLCCLFLCIFLCLLLLFVVCRSEMVGRKFVETSRITDTNLKL